ncbi:MAG: class I mannose-6-phosphate isomerase [Planctomycetales bacterium]|nr:class I mannose-6-phosphate isomerase [Planctomycetales bacterium]
MTIDYPLRFSPIYRRYLWGGRRLATALGKSLGEGTDYAESWEIVDHGDDQSCVTDGPLAGRTLHDLLVADPKALLGAGAMSNRFPLLFKFLDCNRKLSVQVHPNDEQASRLTPPDLGKTEAWVIVDAEPGSKVYAGLKRGFDRDALAREVARGTTELCLHSIEVQAGDCIFIPAGTVHALGDGLLVAEIQQSSDTTFRLFDWNRVDASGQSRPLHVSESLETIDYTRGPIAVQQPKPTAQAGRERLVECDKFVLDRWTLPADGRVAEPTGGSFRLLAVLSGILRIDGDPANEPLRRGEVALVPAGMPELRCCADEATQMLDITLPVE